MNLKTDPAYAWLYREAGDEATASGFIEWEETDGIFKRKRFSHPDPLEFFKRVQAEWKDPVEAAREYADGILAHLKQFRPELREVVELRAKEIQNWAARARNAQSPLLALTHIHYLRREIEILRVVVPLAKAKLRSQSGLPNATPEARQTAEANYAQWRLWDAALIQECPKLAEYGKKTERARELKRRHGIRQAIRTIRKKI
jgi:hypothetical protein